MDGTKRCPLCGEVILRVAVRCKHCQADLRALEPASTEPAPSLLLTDIDHLIGSEQLPMPFPPRPAPPAPAPPPRRAEYVAPLEGDFEQRFLDFAFKTSLPISAVTVAYALKIPIKEASDGLEDLAARDILNRDVDDQGQISFVLPGRHQIAAEMSPGGPGTALSPYAQPPPLLYEPSLALTRSAPESTALAGLLVNVLFLPGLGSLIGGKTNAGIFQLLMFLLGIPLCLSIIGLVVGGPMVMGAWIWGLVSGVNMLSEAKAASQQRQLAG